MPLLPEARPSPPRERTSRSLQQIIGSQRENVQSAEINKQTAAVTGALGQVRQDADEIFRMQVASETSKQANLIQEGINTFQEQILEANEVEQLDPVQEKVETFLEESLTEFPFNPSGLQERFTPSIGGLRNRITSRKKSLLARDASAQAKNTLSQALDMADGTPETYNEAANHYVNTLVGLGEIFGNEPAKAAIRDGIPRIALAHALQEMNQDPEAFHAKIFAFSPAELAQDPILGDLSPEQRLQLMDVADSAVSKHLRRNTEVFHSGLKNDINDWVSGRSEMPEELLTMFLAENDGVPPRSPDELLEFVGREVDFPPSFGKDADTGELIHERVGGVKGFYDDKQINLWKRQFNAARQSANKSAVATEGVMDWIKGAPGSRPPNMHDRQTERAVEMLEIRATDADPTNDPFPPSLYSGYETRDYGSTSQFYATYSEIMPTTRATVSKMLSDYEGGGTAGLGAAVALTEIMRGRAYRKDYHSISPEKAAEIRTMAKFALDSQGNIEQTADHLTNLRREARENGFEFTAELGASRDFVLTEDNQNRLRDLSSDAFDEGSIPERAFGAISDFNFSGELNESQRGGIWGPILVPEHGEISRGDMVKSLFAEIFSSVDFFDVLSGGQRNPAHDAAKIARKRREIADAAEDFEFGNVRNTPGFNSRISELMTLYRSYGHDQDTSMQMATAEAMRTGWGPTLFTKDGHAEWSFRPIEESDAAKLYGAGHMKRNFMLRKHASDDLAAEGRFHDPVDILLVADPRGVGKLDPRTGGQGWNIMFFDRADPTETDEGTWKILQNPDGSNRVFLPNYDETPEAQAKLAEEERRAELIKEAQESGLPLGDELTFIDPEAGMVTQSMGDLGAKLRESFNAEVAKHPKLESMITAPTLEELKALNGVASDFPHTLALLQQRMALEDFDPNVRKRVQKGIATGEVSEDEFRKILRAILPDELTPEQLEDLLSRSGLPFVRMNPITQDIRPDLIVDRLMKEARKEGVEVPDVIQSPPTPRVRIEREATDPRRGAFDPELKRRMEAGDDLDILFEEVRRGSRFRQGVE